MRSFSDKVKEYVSKMSEEEKQKILSNRRAFCLYSDKLSLIMKLSLEQRGMLMTMIFQKQNGIEPTDFGDIAVSIAYEAFAIGFESDISNYLHITARNRLNIEKWNKQKGEKKEKTSDTHPVGADKDTDNDTDKDKDTDNDIDTDKDIDKSLRYKDKSITVKSEPSGSAPPPEGAQAVGSSSDEDNGLSWFDQFGGELV